MNDAPAMWRGAITDTIHLMDIILDKHQDSRKSKGKLNLEKELNDLMSKWFSYSRGQNPTTYQEAFDSFKNFLELTNPKYLID